VHPLRVPIPPIEPITHTLRVQHRRLHVRQDFYTLDINPEVRDLLLQLALFMDITNYEVKIWELTAYLYGYGRPFPQVLNDLLAIPHLCYRADPLTIVFNVETLDDLGVRVVDSSKLHQPAKGEHLTPEQSKLHEQAIEIMINQLKAVVGFREETLETPERTEEGAVAQTPVSDSSEALKTRIEDLELSSRTISALEKANIRTVGGLARKKEQDLMDIEWLGPKSIQEIKRALANFGIVLK